MVLFVNRLPHTVDTETVQGSTLQDFNNSILGLCCSQKFLKI